MNHSLKAGMKFAPANFVASIPVNVLSCCHCKVAVSYYYQNWATSMQNCFPSLLTLMVRLLLLLL